MLAGQGYVVAVPEVYHEYEPAGIVLAYDKPGTDRGNALNLLPVAAYDADARSRSARWRRIRRATGDSARSASAWAGIWRTAPRSTRA